MKQIFGRVVAASATAAAPASPSSTRDTIAIATSLPSPESTIATAMHDAAFRRPGTANGLTQPVNE
jgi:hypothetical protein